VQHQVRVNWDAGTLGHSLAASPHTNATEMSGIIHSNEVLTVLAKCVLPCSCTNLLTGNLRATGMILVIVNCFPQYDNHCGRLLS